MLSGCFNCTLSFVLCLEVVLPQCSIEMTCNFIQICCHVLFHLFLVEKTKRGFWIFKILLCRIFLIPMFLQQDMEPYKYCSVVCKTVLISAVIYESKRLFLSHISFGFLYFGVLGGVPYPTFSCFLSCYYNCNFSFEKKNPQLVLKLVTGPIQLLIPFFLRLLSCM